MSDRLNWEEGNNNYLSAAIIWLRLKLERKLSEPLTLPKAITDIDVAKAATTKLAAEALESPPALITLSKLFELSRFEQDVLLLCVAIELDTRIATICAHVHDDPNKPYPCNGYLAHLFKKVAPWAFTARLFLAVKWGLAIEIAGEKLSWTREITRVWAADHDDWSAKVAGEGCKRPLEA